MTLIDEEFAAELAMVEEEEAARDRFRWESIARNRVAARAAKLAMFGQEAERRRVAGLSLVHDAWPGCPAPDADLWGGPLAVGGGNLTSWPWRLKGDGVWVLSQVVGAWRVCSPVFPLRLVHGVAPRFRDMAFGPEGVVDSDFQELIGAPPVVVAVQVKSKWVEVELEWGLNEDAVALLAKAGLWVNPRGLPLRVTKRGHVEVAEPCGLVAAAFLREAINLVAS